MSKCIFSLGKINIKLIFPLIDIILYIIINIFKSYIDDYSDAIFFLYYIGYSLGQIMTIFINFMFKYRKVYRKKKKKEQFKTIFKNYSLLIMINTLYFLSQAFTLAYLFRLVEKSISYYYFIDCLEIVFLTVITHFILKYKYYIHHIISIIIIVIFGIIIDIFFSGLLDTNIIFLTGSVFFALIDSLIYSYFKYLIEFKYYYFMDVLLIFGINNLVLYIIIYSFSMVKDNNSDKNIIVFQLYEIYTKTGIIKMIIPFLFGLIMEGFIFSTIKFLILDKLTPNYVIISRLIGKAIASLFLMKESYIIVLANSILSILQIFGLLFYLEIFEFNFCSLNKNTERNILERERMQAFDDNNDDDEIIIKGYDISEIMKKQNEEIIKKDEESQAYD